MALLKLVVLIIFFFTYIPKGWTIIVVINLVTICIFVYLMSLFIYNLLY